MVNFFHIFEKRLMVLSGLLSIFMPAMLAVDPTCNYYQNMDVGVSYYVYNKEYPNNYNSPIECLWRAVAPNGYQIEVNCELEIPESQSCSQDRVMISLNGDSNLQNAYAYCGKGSTGPLYTESNSVAIGLSVTSYYPGGKFICTLKTKTTLPPPCDCGSVNTRRIVGGVETKVNEFPMMAALIDSSIRDLFCGATIIASRYALSAAHCTKDKYPSITGLLVGDHNISSEVETGATKLYNIIQFIQHPMYDPLDPKGLNDIVIIKTDETIEFNMQVGPACLPFINYKNSFAGDSVDALGWGTTEFTGPKSEVLLKTDLDVLAYDECYRQEGGVIDQMCTYKAGHDSCQSDSGGPLLWMDPASYRINLVGIISSGYGCATTHAGLNTRVTSYLMWITSMTPGASYCIK